MRSVLTIAAASFWLVGCTATDGTRSQAPQPAPKAAPTSKPVTAREPARARPLLQVVEEAAGRVGIKLHEGNEISQPPHTLVELEVRKVSLGCTLKLLKIVEAEGPALRVRDVELRERWRLHDSFDLSFKLLRLAKARAIPSALRREQRDPYGSVTGGLHALLRTLGPAKVRGRTIYVRPDRVYVKGYVSSMTLVDQLRRGLAAKVTLNQVKLGKVDRFQGRVHFRLSAAVKQHPSSARPFTASCEPGRVATPASAPTQPTAAPAAPAPPRPPGWIRKVGPTKWMVDRKVMLSVLADTRSFARSARFIPAVDGSKPQGFTLYAIRPGSVLQQLGLRNGDTVHTILGRKLTTPDSVLKVHKKLARARRIRLTFSRRGKRITHAYVVR